MKFHHLILVVLFAAASSGCRDNPAPTPEVKVDSASEALWKDQQDIAKRLAEQKAAAEANFQRERALAERAQHLEVLLQIANKLSSAVAASNTTGRRDFGPLIQTVEAIKVEAEAVAVDDCTGKVRSDLLEAVATTLDAFNTFAKETVAPSEGASKGKFRLATDQVDGLSKALSACRNN